MISKSKSRSYKGGFRQLLNDYFGNKEYLERFTWNMYSNRFNDDELIKEFRKNAEHLKNARGKNYLYHEIISLPHNNLSDGKIKDILHNLATKYLNKRANNHLAFGIVHNDKKHPHIHLVFSSNEINGTKRVRLSKDEFEKIQIELEEYKNTHFTELKQTHHYKQNSKEQKLTKKQQIINDLQDIFSKAQSKTALERSLKNKGFEISIRANTTRVIFENKPYRLKTLKLENEYNKTLSRLEKSEQRKEKRQEFKQSKQQQDFSQSQTLWKRNKSEQKKTTNIKRKLYKSRRTKKLLQKEL